MNKSSKVLDKCDFCRYWNGHVYMASSNTNYCKDALYEYFQYKRENGQPSKPVKSIHSWDRNR